MPKVSVIVPNYNHARFLEQRIRSVLEQSFGDFELIYLDDCSTDNSAEVFARFRHHPKIKVVLNETNSGSPFKQANKGIRMAQGEYVWVAEADDYADKDFLAAMVPVLDRHPSVGFVYCQSWAVNERGAILRSMSKKTGDFEDSDRWERDYVNQGRDECRRYLLMRNIVPNLSGVLFRREVMERIGCFDETFRVAGDYVTWVKMALNGDVAYVARPLNYFRHHAGAVRHKLRSGVSVHENYAVLRYISRQLHLSNAEINPVCDRMLKMWTRRAFTVHGRIPIRMSMEIYRTARQVDHRLFRRFLWQLLPKGLRRTRKSAKASLPRDEGGAKKEGTPFVR